MSQSFENNVNPFVVLPLKGVTQEETSISGGVPIQHATAHVTQGSVAQGSGIANPLPAQANPSETERAEAAYQGIMVSLPTFIKKLTPPDLTDEQIDGFQTYFSIPHDKVDMHLALAGESLFLPHIDEKSSDPNLTPG
ncbi:hypothetical protein LIER_39581 [Lithospermum erythrorhizon]|uniref:Uncharacterized protein n=1 Tax=Lithospermum erythrorhizon TaxID=34254 RepID=A0AAV3QMG1_LITER